MGIGGIETREFEGTDTVRNSPVFSFALAYELPSMELALLSPDTGISRRSNIKPEQSSNATGFGVRRGAATFSEVSHSRQL